MRGPRLSVVSRLRPRLPSRRRPARLARRRLRRGWSQRRGSLGRRREAAAQVQLLQLWVIHYRAVVASPHMVGGAHPSTTGRRAGCPVPGGGSAPPPGRRRRGAARSASAPCTPHPGPRRLLSRLGSLLRGGGGRRAGRLARRAHGGAHQCCCGCRIGVGVAARVRALHSSGARHGLRRLLWISGVVGSGHDVSGERNRRNCSHRRPGRQLGRRGHDPGEALHVSPRSGARCGRPLGPGSLACGSLSLALRASRLCCGGTHFARMLFGGSCSLLGCANFLPGSSASCSLCIARLQCRCCFRLTTGTPARISGSLGGSRSLLVSERLGGGRGLGSSAISTKLLRCR